MVNPLNKNDFSLGIERLFTRETIDAFDLIHFHEAETSGDETVSAFESPDNWSNEATGTLAKLAAHKSIPTQTKLIEENTVPSWLWRRTGDTDEQTAENSIKQIFHRVAGAATYAGWKKGLFAGENEARIFFDETRYMFAQRFIALEPSELSSLGLSWAYGLEGKPAKITTLSTLPAPFEANLIAKKVKPDVDIRNTSIDALLGGDKNIRSKWQKLLSTGTKAGYLSLRFVDITSDWNGGQKASARAAIDLLAFRREDNSLDIDRLSHAIKWLAILLTLSEEHSGANISMGLHNLSPLLMSQGLAYDSDAGRATAAAIAAVVTAEAYATSAQLAGLLGASLDYAANPEGILRTLRNHRRTAYGDRSDYEKISVLPAPISLNAGADLAVIAAARRRWDEALELVRQHGLRFTQVTDLATTPALAYFMESITRGVNPMPALAIAHASEDDIHRRDVHPAVVEALTKLGYDRATRTTIIDHIAGAKTLTEAPGVNHALLRRHGFDSDALQRVEHYLPCVNDIRLAFTTWILGEDFMRKTLKIPSTKVMDPRFDLLDYFGFLKSDIAAANAFCYGHGSAVGAKKLRPSHTSILAQAREISAEARIRMAAAVQGLISGDAGLQVNTVAGTAVEDTERLLLNAWRQGVKSISIEFTASEQAGSRKAKSARQTVRAKMAKRVAAPQPQDYGASLRSALGKRRKASGQMVGQQAGKSNSKKRGGSHRPTGGRS